MAKLNINHSPPWQGLRNIAACLPLAFEEICWCSVSTKMKREQGLIVLQRIGKRRNTFITEYVESEIQMLES